jgi:2,3-dihydroxybenzoate decarboxylase
MLIGVDGIIALEEHFVTSELRDLVPHLGWSEDEAQRLVERLQATDQLLEEMNRAGVETAVLSLNAPGIQGIQELETAISEARRANDALELIVSAHPGRLEGFAALPMQDPVAAAEELTRAIRELGFKGALVNGYSNVPKSEDGVYYDGSAYLSFWEQVEALGVPFYLHPRNPLPSMQATYAGRSELLGPTWAFAVETATHALRMIASGLFDRFPNLQIIVGHLGELLPFALPRFERRLRHITNVHIKRPATHYFHENFMITTSGNYHTPSLIGILLELGATRVLFAGDYPFEEMSEGVEWLRSLPISDSDKLKIGRTNAQHALGLL